MNNPTYSTRKETPDPVDALPSASGSGSGAACEDCKFFVPSRENPFTGICRRYPPSVKDKFGIDFWPTVGRSAWCGEYKHQNDASSATRRPGASENL